MNPLKRLLELAQQKEDLEAAMRRTVAEARLEKHSWQAIANVIGGTKQAAQQKYSGQKAADRLLADQVAAHHAEDSAKLAEYAAKREAAAAAESTDAGQLEGQTAIFLDGTAPATGQLDDAKPVYDWQDPTPRRTAAAPVDVEDDLTHVESGELDTAGNTIDWTGRGAPKCYYCGKTHHYEGKGRSRYFWIYPGCNPTHRDRQFTPEGATK